MNPIRVISKNVREKEKNPQSAQNTWLKLKWNKAHPGSVDKTQEFLRSLFWIGWLCEFWKKNVQKLAKRRLNCLEQARNKWWWQQAQFYKYSRDGRNTQVFWCFCTGLSLCFVFSVSPLIGAGVRFISHEISFFALISKWRYQHRACCEVPVVSHSSPAWMTSRQCAVTVEKRRPGKNIANRF